MSCWWWRCILWLAGYRETSPKIEQVIPWRVLEQLGCSLVVGGGSIVSLHSLQRNSRNEWPLIVAICCSVVGLLLLYHVEHFPWIPSWCHLEQGRLPSSMCGSGCIALSASAGRAGPASYNIIILLYYYIIILLYYYIIILLYYYIIILLYYYIIILLYYYIIILLYYYIIILLYYYIFILLYYYIKTISLTYTILLIH